MIVLTQTDPSVTACIFVRVCHLHIQWCFVSSNSSEYSCRFKSVETKFFCLRVMVGVIILYDHVHPVGAFAKHSGIEVTVTLIMHGHLHTRHTFFIHMCIIMYLWNELCLASWLAVLHGENVGHNVQTFWPDVFIPAILIGTIDLHHYTTFSDLDLGWGSQGLTHCLTDQNEVWCGVDAVQVERRYTIF